MILCNHISVIAYKHEDMKALKIVSQILRARQSIMNANGINYSVWLSLFQWLHSHAFVLWTSAPSTLIFA